MAVAVVIVTFNSAPDIGAALDSLPPGLEVIVVDNASSDATEREVARRGDTIRWLGLKENVGFGRAVNLGARASRSDNLLFLNPDARLTSSTPGEGCALRRMEALLDEHGACALGPKLIDEKGAWQLSIGGWPSLTTEALRCVVQRQLDKGGALAGVLRRAMRGALLRPRFVPWVSGAALMVRRSAFLRVGGFDPQYFLFFEDIDLCLRLWHAGGRVLFAPEIECFHARGQSAKRAPTLAALAYRDSQAKNARRYMHPVAAELVDRYAKRRKAALGAA